MAKFDFEEVYRNVNSREVRGKLYDGLTFKLQIRLYLENRQTWEHNQVTSL